MTHDELFQFIRNRISAEIDQDEHPILISLERRIRGGADMQNCTSHYSLFLHYQSACGCDECGLVLGDSDVIRAEQLDAAIIECRDKMQIKQHESFDPVLLGM